MKNNKKIGKVLASVGATGLLSSLIIPFLTSCTGTIEGMEPSQIINNLFPNIWVLVGVLFSSVVLFIALIYLVWKPAEKMIAKRQEYVMSEIRDAEETKKLADSVLVNARQEKINASVEASRIVDDASTRAKNIIDDATSEAQIQANILTNKTLINLRKEKIKAEQEIRTKGVEMAFELAQSIMEKNVSANDNQEFVDKFIETFNKQ